MTETIALHGEKPLLIEARKLLIEAGFKDDKGWNDWYQDVSYIRYIKIYLDNTFNMYINQRNVNTIIDLTTENLTTVIELLKTKLCNTNSH